LSLAVSALATMALAAITMPTTALAGGGGGICGGNGPLTAPAPVGSSTVQVFRFSGLDAQAIWESTASDGTFTSVYVGETIPGGSLAPVVLIGYFQSLDGQATFAGSNQADPGAVFSIGNDLSSASVTATAQVADFLGSNTSVPVSVNVRWSANGSIQHVVSTGSPSTTAGILLVRHLNALCQPASASGTVFAGSSGNLASGIPTLSEIDRTIDGLLVVTK